MLFQIHIPRRHTKCQIGEEKIEAGMEYHSILFEEGEETYSRVDCCPACWEQADKEELLKGSRTHWKSKVPDKVSADEKTLRRIDRSLEMLKEESNPERAVLLAMFLQRKKILLFRQELVRDDGSAYLLYEVKGTEEMLPVPKLSISNIDVAAAQKEMLAAFNG